MRSPVSAVKAANMPTTASDASFRRRGSHTWGTGTSTRSVGVKSFGCRGRFLLTTTQMLVGSSTERAPRSKVGTAVASGDADGVGRAAAGGVGVASLPGTESRPGEPVPAGLMPPERAPPIRASAASAAAARKRCARGRRGGGAPPDRRSPDTL
jgi:hypothetical protein